MLSSEYEQERKNQECKNQECKDNERNSERSEYAFDAWMSGKSYDDAWYKWEANNG